MQDSPEAPLDVLIIGAGLSGIGAARHLQRECPGRRFAIVEARSAIGGTWDLFRYPGVRSDSDMYTLGYRFKPWTDAKAIADGPAILAYIREAAREGDLEPLIRFNHRATQAEWSSTDACWTVTLEHPGGPGTMRTTSTLRARFLHTCAGYYRYTEAHRPAFEGEGDFRGRIVHPQFWPADLDWAGKRVLVVGSGATAVTLVPEMAKSAAQVTMLQRSPSYVLTLPSRDAVAGALRALLPLPWAYALTRWKNALFALGFFKLARRYPQGVKRLLMKQAARQLGPGIDVQRHFNPRYGPWDQRLCLVPDGDLFRALRSGRAQIVTDHIERFTEGGVRLASGSELAADIVVLATGLTLNGVGDMQIAVDGQAVDLRHSMSYKGMMLSGLPNAFVTIGYSNASWTLKADLTAGFVCRLLNHMQRQGLSTVVARRDPAVAERPFLDLSSGYVQRALADLPKQGDRSPWRVHQSYVADLLDIRHGRLDDGTLHFGRQGSTA
jgi:monooxygenase